MSITLAVDEDIVRDARRNAESLGTSVNQVVRDFLEQFKGKTGPAEDAAQFEQLSYLAQGNSQGWKFNREELHER